MHKARKPLTRINIYIALATRILLLLIIYTLCRIGFYAFNASLFHGMNPQKFIQILLGGVKFDICALFYLNSLYVLLQIIPFTFRYRDRYQRFCKWLFIITNSIGISFNLVDFVYYQFTLKRTTASVFSQFAHEQNKMKLGFTFLIDFWYLPFLFVILIWGLIKLYDLIGVKRAHVRSMYVYGITRFVTMLVIATIIVFGMRGGWRHSTRPITLSNAGEFVDSPDEMSLVLNTPFTIMKTIGIKKLQEKHYFDDQTLAKLYNPIHTPHPDSTFKPLNVVMIIIESLGKESVGELNKDLLGGKYKGYTPFIDSLLENSLAFTNAYANGHKSIDALPSVISSIPSIQEPFVLSAYSGNKVNSLPQVLKDKGYHTSFFHGAPNGSMGFSSYVKLAGVDHYYGKTEYNNDADFDGIWGIWDEPFLQYFAKELNTIKPPFCSTVFTVSSHHPFKVPEQYEGKFPKGPLPVQECFGYTDMALSKFFATAAKMPWFKNTLFVLTADHATITYLPEYQNIQGGFAIPMLIYYPGGNLKAKVDKLAQQIDIMPTVLSMLNYNKPYFAFGNNLMAQGNDNFVVNNNDGNYNFYLRDYVLFNNEDKSTGLYNLKKDRFMKNNLLNTEISVKQEMEIKLKAFIQQYNNRMIADKISITNRDYRD